MQTLETDLGSHDKLVSAMEDYKREIQEDSVNSASPNPSKDTP